MPSARWRADVDDTSSRTARQRRVQGALLQACHSLAGVPDDELALPDLLGKVLLSKLPGNQAQALACVQLIREKQPAGSGVDGRLACCPILVQGLQAAKGSANEEVARDASSLLGAFQKARV